MAVACGNEPAPTAVPPTAAPTVTPVPTATPIPTATATLAPTATPIPTATPMPTATPAPTNTPMPTATPTPTQVPTATPMPFVGEWVKVTDEINPLTRTREASIALLSKDGERALHIRCHESGLEFLMAWGRPDTMDPISESFGTTVQHRIGDDPVEALEWSLSTNDIGTFMPNDRIANTIRKMYDADEFVIQVTPDRSGPITAVFEIAGLYWAIKPVLEACEVEIN